MKNNHSRVRVNGEGVDLTSVWEPAPEPIELTALNFVRIDGSDQYFIESGFTEGGRFSKRAKTPPISFPGSLSLPEVAERETGHSRAYVDVFVDGELYMGAAR